MAHTCAVGMLWDDEGDAPAVVRIGQALGLDRDRLEGQDPETIEELRRLLAELHLKSAPLDQGDTSIKKLCEETDATFPKDLRRVYVIDSIQSARLGLDEDDLDDRQKANAATDYLKREMRRQDSIAIVTSQANRRSYASGRPGENSSPLSSAMNSAGIEYAGHVVIVLSGDTDKTLTLNVVKNRLGSKGSASFTWDARRAAVREVDEETLERSADEADQIALAGKIKKAEDVLRRRPGLTSALWRKGSKLDGPDFCVVFARNSNAPSGSRGSRGRRRTRSCGASWSRPAHHRTAASGVQGDSGEFGEFGEKFRVESHRMHARQDSGDSVKNPIGVSPNTESDAAPRDRTGHAEERLTGSPSGRHERGR